MAVPLQFSQQQAFAAKYWYERLQYTWGPQSLNVGTTPVVAVSRINRSEIPLWAAEVSNLAATQRSDVALDMVFDQERKPALVDRGQTAALRAGVRPDQDGDDGRVGVAVNNLSISLKNSGTAAVSGFQFNYQVAMRRLTVADKLRRGISKFTQDELDALNDRSIDVRGLYQKGTVPISLSRQIRETVQARAEPDLILLQVSATTTDTAFYTIRANEKGPDRFLVLRRLAIEGAPAVWVSVDRDDDLNYMGVNGAAFVNADDAAWDVFIPALNFLTFHIQAAAPVSNVPIRILVWHVPWSDILRVRFGLVKRGDVPDEVYLRVLAGVV